MELNWRNSFFFSFSFKAAENKIRHGPERKKKGSNRCRQLHSSDQCLQIFFEIFQSLVRDKGAEFEPWNRTCKESASAGNVDQI